MNPLKIRKCHFLIYESMLITNEHSKFYNILKILYGEKSSPTLKLVQIDKRYNKISVIFLNLTQFVLKLNIEKVFNI